VEKNDNIKIVNFTGSSKPAEIDEEEYSVKLVYGDGNEEIIHADAFAVAEEFPGTVVFWKEKPFYEILCYVNISHVRKLVPVPRKDASGDNVA
jgi:hypothetical protein